MLGDLGIASLLLTWGTHLKDLSQIRKNFSLRRLLEAETELVDDAAVIETSTRLRAALRSYV